MVIGIALVVAGFLLTALLPILFWIGIPMALIGAAMVLLYFTKNTASLATAASRGAFRAATTKNCPDCKSRIAADAIVCAHCGYRYDADEALGSKLPLANVTPVAPDSRQLETSGVPRQVVTAAGHPSEATESAQDSSRGS